MRCPLAILLLAACASTPKPPSQVVNLSATLHGVAWHRGPGAPPEVTKPDPNPITPTNPPLPTNPTPKEKL